MINDLIFCYIEYTNVNKIIWVGNIDNKYLYLSILYISMAISLKFN